MSLDIKNLKLGYEEKIIINDITISIPKGKITMLIGANGCGKSTLLHGMSRLLKPISGEVSLNGVSVHEYKPKEFAKKLANISTRAYCTRRNNCKRTLLFWKKSL